MALLVPPRNLVEARRGDRSDQQEPGNGRHEQVGFVRRIGQDRVTDCSQDQAVGEARAQVLAHVVPAHAQPLHRTVGADRADVGKFEMLVQ